MEEFALKIQLISNETLRSSLSAWLDFWTLLVFEGVVLEIAYLVWEFWEERSEFQRGIVSPPEHPNLLKYTVGVLATGMVIAGIGGELNLQIRIGEVESKIEEVADSLQDLLSKRASENEKEAARLRLDNTRLEALIQPRSLSPEQRHEIGKRLRPFRGETVPIFVMAFDNEEAYNTGLQIESALKCAGINTMLSEFGPSPLTGRMSPILTHKTGIEINWSDNKRIFGRELDNALRTIGKLKLNPSKQETTPVGNPGHVNITVFAKPFDVIAAEGCKTIPTKKTK